MSHSLPDLDPPSSLLARHAEVIERELTWFQTVLDQRFASRHDEVCPILEDLPPPPPLPPHAAGPLAAVLRERGLDAAERLVLILALVPHLAPELLDPFLLNNKATRRRFSEFGGLVGQAHAGFLPTVETALFLVAGSDRLRRLQARALFSPGHRLLAARLIEVDHLHPEEPPASAALRLPRESLERLLAGREDDAFAGAATFPAERVTTPLGWDDLVLDAATREQVDMVSAWIRHSETLLRDWGLARRLKPGYRCLFHGSPGTGKTLTACLLGRQHDMPVYRVDLSRVVSKWVGETEKNLAALFDEAQHHRWILYFDEAEALFGRRGEAHTANDRAANQQIAYLLQRLEDFPGLVILSTNLRGHMDDAFARRFQSTILFPMPDAAARLRLWKDMFCQQPIPLARDVDFRDLAAQHALAGGAIINVLRHACLRAVVRTPPVVTLADIMGGVKLELQKEGHYLRR